MRHLMLAALAIISFAVSWPAPQAAQATDRASSLPPSTELRAVPLSVGIHDHYFGAPTIRVSPGTTIRWVNQGKQLHTITSVNGLFDSGDLAPGSSHSEVSAHPGVYGYYCRYHMQDRMRGTIVVGYLRSQR